MAIFSMICAAAFALFGRWLQLHPEKLVPAGHFIGPHTFGARLFRLQVAFLGTFAVFGGITGALYTLLQFATFGSVVLGWIALLLSIAAGVFVAVRVRREVKARPVHESKSPYGWWP